MKKSNRQIPLETVQRWMQSVIEHPGTNEESWHSGQAQEALPYDEALSEVLPSKTLSPMERIAIYRRMFFLRMTESMAIDYPGVKQRLGEEAFDRLIADDYIRKYPSTSHTLNHLGRHFPKFILESKLKEKEFLYDLARLELSITTMMDMDESPLLTQKEIEAVAPEQWETAQLIPIAALELLQFRYDVCSYLDAVVDETEPAEPKAGTSYAAVYRNNFRMYWSELSEQQFTLLSSLASGTPFGKAIESLTDQFSGPGEDIQKKLFLWFGEWVQNGFFSRIEIQE